MRQDLRPGQLSARAAVADNARMILAYISVRYRAASHASMLNAGAGGVARQLFIRYHLLCTAFG